jgi:hypothetical protein
MEVKFYYQNKPPKPQLETLIRNFSSVVEQVIELPTSIEVCLYDLGHSVYGGIDVHVLNRLGLNYNLSAKEIPLILIHELIHVNQKHKKILEIRRNGHFYWHGIPYTNQLPENLSYEEYENLPWEHDVKNRQSKVLQEVLHRINTVL